MSFSFDINKYHGSDFDFSKLDSSKKDKIQDLTNKILNANPNEIKALEKQLGKLLGSAKKGISVSKAIDSLASRRSQQTREKYLSRRGEGFIQQIKPYSQSGPTKKITDTGKKIILPSDTQKATNFSTLAEKNRATWSRLNQSLEALENVKENDFNNLHTKLPIIEKNIAECEEVLKFIGQNEMKDEILVLKRKFEELSKSAKAQAASLAPPPDQDPYLPEVEQVMHGLQGYQPRVQPKVVPTPATPAQSITKTPVIPVDQDAPNPASKVALDSVLAKGSNPQVNLPRSPISRKGDNKGKESGPPIEPPKQELPKQEPPQVVAEPPKAQPRKRGPLPRKPNADAIMDKDIKEIEELPLFAKNPDIVPEAERSRSKVTFADASGGPIGSLQRYHLSKDERSEKIDALIAINAERLKDFSNELMVGNDNLNHEEALDKLSQIVEHLIKMIEFARSYNPRLPEEDYKVFVKNIKQLKEIHDNLAAKTRAQENP